MIGLFCFALAVLASPFRSWSNGVGHPARDGEPSCVIMLQRLPPWTCLLSQRLAQIALCLRHRSARPQTSCPDQRHGTSNRLMGSTSNNGGISLERGSALHDP